MDSRKYMSSKLILAVFCLHLSLSSHSQIEQQGKSSESMNSTKDIHSQDFKKNPPPGKEIQNGEKARKDEFRYIVSIGSPSNPVSFLAAGVIIGAKWILTAKHVVMHGLSFSGLIVTPNYGNNLKSNLENIKKYKVNQYFCPNGSHKYNDIAIMKLMDDIPLNQKPYKFEKIEMIQENFRLDPKKDLIVAGWGSINVSIDQDGVPHGPLATDLMKVKVQLKPDQDCQEGYKDRFRAPSKMCTSGYPKGTCNGDSGGPVVIQNEGKDVLVGTVSGGHILCKSLAFQNNVSYWRHWIDDVMKHENPSDICAPDYSFTMENLFNRKVE